MKVIFIILDYIYLALLALLTIFLFLIQLLYWGHFSHYYFILLINTLFIFIILIVIKIVKKLSKSLMILFKIYFYIIIFILTFSALFCTLYIIISRIYPATIVVEGVIRKVMPFAQIGLSIIISFFTGIIIIYIYIKSNNLIKRLYNKHEEKI